MFSVLSPGYGQMHAFGLLLSYCLIYVAPLHAWPPARASPTRSRDDDGAIRARIRAVSLSTLACSLMTLSFLSPTGMALHLMGYVPLGITEAVRALGLTALLFAGPLYENLFMDGTWRDCIRLGPLRNVWSDWPSWRNLVAGPITEECLFRSAAIPLLLQAGCTLRETTFLSPLVFGVAHLHHFYEFRVTHPNISLTAAIVRSVVQFSYTYLFGIYATFIFLRTGSLLAVIIVHAFCNSMGLPRVWGLVEPHWLSHDMSAAADRSIKFWSILYYGLLVGGMLAWCRNLYPMSQSAMALDSF